MTTPGIAIGLDLGTSGLRAALISADGATLSLANVPIAEEDRRTPQAWWQASIAAVRNLDADLCEVRAIAVDGTSGTVLPIDAQGEPLGPASLYNDPADPMHAASIAAIAAPDSAARGAASPLAKILGWRRLPRLARVLHEADWLAARLHGRFDITDWNNALKTGFDPRTLCWPDWLEKLDIDRALLPTPVEPGTALGPITHAAAAALGLAPNTIVAAGTTDGCAAFLATGAAEPGDGVTSLGSTLTLKMLSPRPIFAPAYGVYSHRLGPLWLAGGASNSGGAALARHFDPATIAALSRRIDPAAPSACDYYPLPATGERFPVADPCQASRHTPRPADDAAFLHGLLLGIARIEVRGYRRLQELGGPAVRTVFSLGAGAANPAWAAIRRRTLGVDLRPPHAPDAASGTARLAARAAKQEMTTG
jgi:sugar (pentulose or hexulose) kinase